MNVLSLFDGISCGLVALERTGIQVDSYFASEIDQNAIAISEKNHNDIIRLGDVTRWKEWKLPKIDLVIGGSPCQGFSRAGKCLNFEDPRSKLFFEFVDILNHIREKNPEVLFLLENVKMKNEWKDVISDYLGVQPIEINSNLVSAQNRPRMYWTNIEGVALPEDKGIKLVDILEDSPPIQCFERYDLLIEDSISDASANLVNVVDGQIRISQAVKTGYIVAEDGDGVNLSFPTSKTRRGRVTKQKSSTLDCQCECGVYRCNTIRKFTMTELERLQTLPDGYTEGFEKNIRKKAIGNGWTVDAITHILSFIRKEKTMELKINNVTFPEAIEFNFDEIKQELSGKVEHYKNLVYTDDQIKDAKKDVAELRKFIKALSDERIKVKKQCLAPYEAFEAKVKELEAVVNEPITLIDGQVKEYAEKQKRDKQDSIIELWKACEKPDWISLASIEESKWLNASTSMKSIQEEMESKLAQIKTDLATLSNLPEFGFEATEIYKTTLDINKAISEGHRLAEIQKKKEEEQARLQAEQENKIETPVEATTPVEETIPVEEMPFSDQDDDDFIPSFDGNEAIWRSYRIQMTTSQKTILEQFLLNSGIKYQEV